MSDELDLTPPTTGKAAKTPKAPKAPKDPAAPKVKKESNLSKTYPKDATITVLAAANPKRAGSKAFDHFALYATCTTVGALTAAGGSIANLAWDVGHGFVKVG
jgi:hypothetical protein